MVCLFALVQLQVKLGAKRLWRSKAQELQGGSHPLHFIVSEAALCEPRPMRKNTIKNVDIVNNIIDTMTITVMII